MTIIVDAGVALKWVIEEGSEAAGALLLEQPLAAFSGPRRGAEF